MKLHVDNHEWIERLEEKTEMEFLDINLTKDSSLLLHAIYSQSLYWQILKLLTKKSTKQENSSLFMNSIFLNGKMRNV